MDDKLDFIIKNMKAYSHDEKQSESDGIIEGWCEDIADAWEEAKSRGRPKYKATKPSKKPCSSSTSSSASSNRRPVSIMRL